MPASYEPVEDAKPVPPWSIALLSERDLTLRVPINFVTVPGVSLSQACFGHNVFEHDAAVTCFSNLLASGFRRFEWDLYWDIARRVWSFCPVQIPQSDSAGPSTTQMFFNSSGVTLSNAVITARATGSPASVLIDTSTSDSQNLRRQNPDSALTSVGSGAAASLNVALGGSTSAPSSSTSASNPSATAGDLISLGTYSCSPSIDLPILAAVLDTFFQSTSNTIEAFLLYLVVNLHVAAPSASISPARLNVTSLPSPQELVSTLLRVNLTSYLYTTSALARDRADVNSSWFKVALDAQPLAGYFNLAQHGSESSSDNGWPNAIDLEFSEQRRLLAQLGLVDPQLTGYNLTSDEDVMFPSGYLQNIQTDIRLDTSGVVENGCIYNENDFTVAENNNSWATYALTQYPAGPTQNFTSQPVTAAANLTTCGVSPFLNTTIFNTTADQNPSPYRDFVRSTTWSWSYGEPRNVSSNEENASRIRCAAIDTTLNGRWRVVDCTDKHVAACRVGSEPFTWQISSSKATYTSSNDICGDGQSFSVPLTPMEHAHLFRRIQQEPPDDHLVWVNFNSLDNGNCWVEGVNTTCPYRERQDDSTGRKIIIPTVAAIIVLIVTALTLLVKCAANRQTNKRRRRRGQSYDFPYEGIPQ